MKPLVLVLLLTSSAFTLYGQTKATDGVNIPTLTVSTLPSAASSNGKSFYVSDGTSQGDCTTGGSTSVALCRSNGTSWVSVGGGSGVTTCGT